MEQWKITQEIIDERNSYYSTLSKKLVDLSLRLFDTKMKIQGLGGKPSTKLKELMNSCDKEIEYINKMSASMKYAPKTKAFTCESIMNETKINRTVIEKYWESVRNKRLNELC